jgi:hypothetical protein
MKGETVYINQIHKSGQQQSKYKVKTKSPALFKAKRAIQTRCGSRRESPAYSGKRNSLVWLMVGGNILKYHMMYFSSLVFPRVGFFVCLFG